VRYFRTRQEAVVPAFLAKEGLPLAAIARVRLPVQARASTPPAEERVTSFFARAKKKVTKKETRGVTPQVFRLENLRRRAPFHPLDRGAELAFRQVIPAMQAADSDDRRKAALIGRYATSTNT
jgi:hypothetical protein